MLNEHKCEFNNFLFQQFQRKTMHSLINEAKEIHFAILML